jgi:hypothetical protein
VRFTRVASAVHDVYVDSAGPLPGPHALKALVNATEASRSTFRTPRNLNLRPHQGTLIGLSG